MSLIAGLGLIGTGGSGSATAPVYATAVTTTLSPTSGQPGSMATYVVTPGPAGFPPGLTVLPVMTGFSTPSAQAPAAGSTTPLTFVLMVTGTGGSTAIANVTINGMTNQTGPQQFAISAAQVYVSPPASRASTKYIATPRASSVDPGTPVIIDLEFNGIIPSSGTISATSFGSNGTLAANTITLDGTAKSFTYTPTSAGKHDITFTNTAGLYNSAPAPLNSWVAGGGAAQALSATLQLGDQAVHYRDVPTGSPRGFSTANTRGHGEVFVNLGQSVPALFARLFDRRSNGATTTAGTGTELTNGWVQVYGAAQAGFTRLLLPAIRAKQLWMDLSASSDGSNPVRVAKCFAVGTILLLSSRSQLTGYARGYNMPNNDDNMNNVYINKIVPWFMTCESVANSPQYGGDTSGTWARVAGEAYDPPSYSNQFFGEPTSNGGMEAGLRIDQQTGMMLGITGCSWIGGGYDQFLDVPSGQVGAGTMATAMAATGGKAHYYLLAGDDFDNIPKTLDNYNSVFTKVPDWIMRNVPTVHVVGMATGLSGTYGRDGSTQFGHGRMQGLILQQEAALCHVVSCEDYHWNCFKNGHASQGARPPYVREHMRLMLSAELASWGGFQTTQRGPTLSGAGTRQGGTVHLPFKLNGGASLATYAFSFPNLQDFTVTTTSPANLRYLITLYPQGQAGDNGTQIIVSNVAINMSNPPSGFDGTLDVTLSDPNQSPGNLDAYFGWDFGVSAVGGQPGSVAYVLTDDIDRWGLGYGQHMRTSPDKITVLAS